MDTNPPLDIPRIFKTREECDQFNTEMLQSAPGSTYVIKCDDTPKVTVHDRKAGGLPQTLHVKLHCRVILLQNINVSEGLVNGSCGLIVDIKLTRPIPPVDGKIECNVKQVHHISIKLDSNGKVYAVKPNSQPFKVRQKVHVRTQVPILLSYASTIHKLQGRTLDSAVISLEKKPKFNPPGMAYVAFSRVKSLQGIHLSEKVANQQFRVDNNVDRGNEKVENGAS